MVLRLGWTGTYVHTQHDDFDDVVGRGAIPIIHDQHMALADVRLSIDAGLTERLGASLALPFRVVSTTIDYLDGMGQRVELVQPNIHHRNETLTGLGDPMVLGSFALPHVIVRAGASIPLGRTEEDPFLLGDMGLSHEHIQMGTGTINPVLSAEASSAWGPWRAGGYVFTQQVVYANSKGYQAGDRYAGGVFGRRAFGAWSARAGVEMTAESSERWHGVRHTDEGNQGRIDVMVALAGSWAMTEHLALDAAVKIPFITHVVGGQLDMPAVVEVGAAWRFGGKAAHHHHHHHGEDDDDDHDHAAIAPPADTSGADVIDVQPPGAAVDLVAVPGKLTIYEFGATWCAPCKTLEPVLLDLARRHPDRVALRRIDVVDWDSAVVARYLTPRGYDLPHVKVFDATGRLVFERSSGPGKLAALIRDVSALVEPASATTAPQTAEPEPATPEPTASETAAPQTTAPETPAPQTPAKPAPRPAAVKPVRISIEVTEKGFQPTEVAAPRGRPVVLVFTRKTDKTCAVDVVIPHGATNIVKELPLDTPVEIPLTFDRAGTVTYACGMNMIRGSIVVK